MKNTGFSSKRWVALILLLTLISSALTLFGCKDDGGNSLKGRGFEYKMGSGTETVDGEEQSTKEANKFFGASYIRFTGDKEVEICRAMRISTYSLNKDGDTYTERDGLFTIEVGEGSVTVSYLGDEKFKGEFTETDRYLMIAREYKLDGRVEVSNAEGSDKDISAAKKELEEAYKGSTLTFSGNTSFTLRAGETYADVYSISFLGCLTDGNKMTQNASCLMNGRLCTVEAELILDGYDGLTLTLKGLADGAVVRLSFENNN